MKNLIQEFKDFINKGDLVTIAVGLILALAFKDVIDKLIEGIINPIIAMIVGESNLTGLGFTIRDSFFSIGMVIDAIITFLAVAAVLFAIVKAYNEMKKKDDAPAGPSEMDVLKEIRDELRKR